MLALAAIVWSSATASAQLDPLLFIKRVPPNVIVIVDTSLSMLTEGNCSLSDGTCTLRDPGFWPTSDPVSQQAFLPPPMTAMYRRKFVAFNYATVHGNGNKQYTATQIDIEEAAFNPGTSTAIPASDLAFLDTTRYGIAKTGIAEAVSENAAITRWGLIRLRQATPSWALTTSPLGVSYVGGVNCAYYVAVSSAAQSTFGDSSPCKASGVAYGIYIPSVSTANYAQTNSGLLVAPGPATASTVLGVVNRAPGDTAGLVPTGVGAPTYEDRPLSLALDDAKLAVTDAMGNDAASTLACRNTVVVLITGGKDSGGSGYTANADTKASSFLAITKNGVTKRVPIHVIGVKVAASALSQLQSIATNSGGVYHDASSAADVTKWINYAVQAGYARAADADAGTPSNFTAVSPIIGTVNLVGAENSAGVAFPTSETTVYKGGGTSGTLLPQRSNVMITGAFELPGFYGRLRAFRVYKPVADSTQPSGYKFVNDGTKLWPDLDGRPDLAGQARAPLDPNTRNIFTWVPDSSGTGGSFVAFTSANASTLTPLLNLPSSITATSLISFIRSQPIGAIIGSTPAMMDPPSLDPPPDVDYGRPDTTDTFAGNHANRRTMIFVGANDGMMHAIDARTGYEVWAFIPYNLLPKLQALYDGQPVDRYEYFVDSSPKIAEVKLDPANSDPAKRWRSLLLFGQGPGGLFYQAFDVTEAGMGVDPTLDGLTAVSSLLASFSDTSSAGPVQFKWAFPNYAHFDPTINQSFTLTDGSPGGALTVWGDLSATKSVAPATPAELTVGYTWSDPAIGPLTSDRSVNGVIVGSGYFPPIETSTSLARGGASAPVAGNVLYLLDASRGTPIGYSGGACAGTGCLSVGDSSNGRKNAIQADPTAAGEYSSPIVTRAYIGDIDGRYWRFNFTSTGTITSTRMVDTGQPIYASSALLFVGSTDVYMFVATGSDSLAGTTPGGTGTFKLYGLLDGTSGATTQFSIPLATVSASGNLITGERPSTSPTVAGDIVFFTTTTESATAPCSDFTASLYATTYLGTAAYDANGNGKIDTNESKIVKTVAGRASAPFIVDQHLYFSTASTASAAGANVEAFGDPQDFNNGVGQVGVRILSWREIR